MTSDDRGALNLPERDAATERTKIETTPLAKIIPMEGGDLKIRVRTTTDGNRASKHPDADHVEIRYALVGGNSEPQIPSPTYPGNPSPPANSAPIAQKVPTTAAECTNSRISKKAIFIVSLG